MIVNILMAFFAYLFIGITMGRLAADLRIEYGGCDFSNIEFTAFVLFWPLFIIKWIIIIAWLGLCAFAKGVHWLSTHAHKWWYGPRAVGRFFLTLGRMLVE